MNIYTQTLEWQQIYLF